MKIEKIKKYRVAYMRRIGTYGVVNEAELEGGDYAIYKINHTTENVQRAWSEIFIDLKQNGYIIDNKPTMERYSKDMIDNGYCDLSICYQNYS